MEPEIVMIGEIVMNKKLSLFMGIVAFACFLGGCSSQSATEKTASSDAKRIGILQYVEHEALTAARQGFIEELEKEGYKDGDTLILDYENAQGDQANLQTVSEKLLANNDLVLGIATPAAQSLAVASSDTPILFTAVTDPVSANLVESLEKPNGLATGTSDLTPMSERIDLLKKTFPNVQKVGMMYTTSERNAEVQVEQARHLFKEAGIELIVKGIASTNEVQDTAKSLMSQTEVLLMPTDNLIDSSFALLADLSKEMKIPIIAGAANLVEEGALFAYGPDYHALGRQTAKQAIRLLKGEKAADLAVEMPQDLAVKVNTDLAKAWKIDLHALANE